jgi:hypothetical protein
MVGTAAYDATQKAFTFSGDDGDAHITRSQIGNSAGAWVHSFSTWVNTNDLSYNHIFSIGADGDNTTSTLRYDAGTGANAFKWFFYGNDVNFTYGTVIDLWLHVVGVYDGGAVAGSRRLWVNGVESVQSSSSGIEALTLPANTQLTLGDRSNRAGDQSLNGEISQFKLYDCTLTAEEAKTLYQMGRCDEGHHVVNFSKTRVGIGLGDGEAPRAALDVRGDIHATGSLNPVAGMWTQSIDSSAVTTTIIKDIGSCMSTKTPDGHGTVTNFTGSAGIFVAPYDGLYQFQCFLVGQGSVSNLLIVFNANGPSVIDGTWSDKNLISDYQELIDLRSDTHVEEPTTFATLLNMSKGDFVDVQNHSTGYLGNNTVRCSCFLVYRI